MTRVSHAIDRIEATFDDPNLVANAGLLLTGDVGGSARAGGVDRRHGEARGPGRRRASGAQGVDVGALDDARAARTSITPICCAPERPASVLGHRVMAPSTLGTFLRAFTLRACPSARSRQRPRPRAGVGRRCRTGRRALVIDIDSTICEVAGKAKQRRRVRLHASARLSPDPGDTRRHRRGVPRPDAQRIGEHPARRAPLHRRTRRPRPSRRRHRRS